MSRAGVVFSRFAALCGRLLAIPTVLVALFVSFSFAAPALPSSALASQAVRSALAPRPAAAQAQNSAAATRAQGVNQAASSAGQRANGRSALVHSTAYNSAPGQTDSTPFITATGTRVRSGVVALSRDLLSKFPYGTRITIEDLSGTYSNFLRGRVFVVEDTMNVRIANTVDVWMGSRGEAMSWGSRNIRITALQ